MRRAIEAALVLVAACSGEPAPGPRVHQVSIRSMTFAPADLQVRVGDTIEWVNDDLVPHTATASPGFDSRTLAPTARWRYTASTPGEIAYGCTLHPTMSGRLHVTPAR